METVHSTIYCTEVALIYYGCHIYHLILKLDLNKKKCFLSVICHLTPATVKMTAGCENREMKDFKTHALQVCNPIAVTGLFVTVPCFLVDR